PLSRLIGTLQHPADDAGSPEQTRHLRAVQRKNCQVLLRMVDNMEALGALASQSPRPVVLDLGGLCVEIVRQSEALASMAGVALELELRGGNLLVSGEETLLSRMIYELLSNALRSAGDGGRVLLRLEKQGTFLLLSVDDSGAGFSPAELALAFDPAHASEAIDNPRGGLGLGLSLCQAVAARHGGRLALLGGGHGRVVVQLPLSQDTTPSPMRCASDLTGGFQEARLRLADVLPWECFTEEEL
ncbi:MAG: HAMP domain-containing histidine kinase, partial [Oscillospiraceae bacterium]|nr:HAMP domain-containing histidine kinase [Oscillospiraceae bacterium]